MITISLETSNPQAVSFAHKMMDSKRQLQNEIKEDSKSSEFLRIIDELIIQNETRRNSEK
jgi:hypothetical protein